MTPHDEAHITALRDIAQSLRSSTLYHLKNSWRFLAEGNVERARSELEEALSAEQSASDRLWRQRWRLISVMADMMSARTISDRRRRIMRTLRSKHDFIDGELHWPPHEEEEEEP